MAMPAQDTEITLFDILASHRRIRVSFCLSVAVPETGWQGGLREIAASDRTVDASALAAHAMLLPGWARSILMEQRSPLGLYVAECTLPEVESSSADWLCEEHIAWSDNSEVSIGLRIHPAVAAAAPSKDGKAPCFPRRDG